MKYRNLKSLAHNFTHSFVSFTNCVDDGYVIDDLLDLARNGNPISIQWIPDSRPDMSLPPRVLLSIAERKSWLPSHIRNSGGDIEAIREFRTDIYLKPNKQIAVEARVLDIRGKEHVSNVYF